MFGLSARQIAIVLVFAVVGWAACGATIGIGMALTTARSALIIHAIGAPTFFGILSVIYARKFGYTRPLTTALVFIAFVVVVDFFLVALTINKSLHMFRSFLGTWLPFILIFGATWITGTLVRR